MKTFNYLTLLALALLAVPAMAQEDGSTIEITLRGLPPPAASPPPTAARGDAAYRQPPVRAEPLPQPAPNQEVVARLGVCEQHAAPIYRGQNQGGRMVARVAQGTYLAIKSDYASWYGVLMVDGSLGWIPKSAVRLLDYNVVRPKPSPAFGPSGMEGLGEEVRKEAFKYLGVPYVWGGNNSNGLDCSGLVKNCFAHCGVPLPRRASEQARVGQPVPLDVAQLQLGDRLYFAVGRPSIDHTGIYLGNGYFIHASMSRGRVAVDHLSKPLYGRHLVAARRS